MFRNVFEERKCWNCGSLLEIDLKRRGILAILGIFPVGLLTHMKDLFIELSLGTATSWIVSTLLLAAWTMYIFSFDKFVLKEPSKSN